MKKSAFLVVGYLFYFIGVLAQSGPKVFGKSSSQTTSEIKALTVGDKVPDIQFENVLNYKSRKARLSDFRGKLVILDMWSTWCTSCIAAFPKMEKLQSEFKQEIQILLVNPHDAKYDSEVKIKQTLEKNKNRSGFYPSLPIPIHDSILNTYFPHRSVPHQVWIDKNGKVIAITGSMEVTAKNIKAILEGKGLNLAIKDDKAFDPDKPLLINNSGGASDDFVFRSIFTGYKGGIGFGGGTRVDGDKQVIGFYLLNNSIRQLINNAYSDSMKGLPESRIIFEVSDLEKYNLQFNPTNAYCYDLTIKPISPNRFDSKEYLKNDLKQFFNISVKREKRKLNCYIINTNDMINQSSTKYQDQHIDLDENSIHKFIHKYSIGEIINCLGVYFDVPLINESKISEQQHIDLDFPENFDLSNSEAILQELKRAGFNIKEEVRELDVIIVSDI